MKQVIVKRIYNGVIDNQYPEKGIYFELENAVIIVDQFGSVDVRKCTPGENDAEVLVAENSEDLLTDNPEYFIGLVMSSVE